MQTTNTKWPNEEEGKQEQPPNHKSPLLPGSNGYQSIVYHLWQRSLKRYQLNDPICSKFAVWDLTSVLLKFFQVAMLQWHMLILVCSNSDTTSVPSTFWWKHNPIGGNDPVPCPQKTLEISNIFSCRRFFPPFPTFIVAANNSDKVSGKRLVDLKNESSYNS